MSDPLSVAASISALLGMGFAVANGLYRIAKGIGSAGQEVRTYADEIDTFSKLLQRIGAELQQQSHNVSSYSRTLLLDIVSICKRVLDPMS